RSRPSVEQRSWESDRFVASHDRGAARFARAQCHQRTIKLQLKTIKGCQMAVFELEIREHWRIRTGLAMRGHVDYVGAACARYDDEPMGTVDPGGQRLNQLSVEREHDALRVARQSLDVRGSHVRYGSRGLHTNGHHAGQMLHPLDSALESHRVDAFGGANERA